MFVAMQLSKEHMIKVRNIDPPLEQSMVLSFADGMIGVLPVFESREDAEKYAPNSEIMEIVEP